MLLPALHVLLVSIFGCLLPPASLLAQVQHGEGVVSTGCQRL